MTKQWMALTADEKKAQRFRWSLDTEGIKFISLDAEKAYKQRVQRFLDVYQVKEPDRVPVSTPPGHLPAYLDGTDFHTVMYDYKRLIQAWDNYLNEMEMDALPSPALVMPGRVLDLLDYRQIAWPGHGLPKSASEIQFVEGEYAGSDMYDALLRDPSDFWLRYYMPQIAGAFESFKMFRPLTDLTFMPIMSLMPLMRPEVQTTLQTLLDAGKELDKYTKTIAGYTTRGITLGYPMLRGGVCLAPFDTIGDVFRGSKGIMVDMYRQPDKLLEAMDVLADIAIHSTIESVNAVKGLTVTFTLHKGDDSFMSLKHFEKFYWPSLKKVILALIAEGIIPVLFAEGCYDARLETVNEFAKGEVAWMFDKTDMTRAKKILGDNCCIHGNVPSSLLHTGTPESVKEYCRKLIEVCGKGGGYILGCGSSVDNVNPDNIRAMMAAAKEYGVYKT